MGSVIMIAKPSGFLEISIAKPSGFRGHVCQTQWVLETSIAKPSGFRDHDLNRQT